MDDRYGTGQKGLNTTGGSNRFKFQGKQARAKQVDVDVAHKVRADGFLDADKAQHPEVEGGSFFQQELDRSKELNVTPPFKRFYYKVRRTLSVVVSTIRSSALGRLWSMSPLCFCHGRGAVDLSSRSTQPHRARKK